LAIAALMNILKKQRDAVGLSIYSDEYTHYSPEKGSERHHQMLLARLNEVGTLRSSGSGTKTYTYLHQIAEKLKRRSLVFLFTDMFQTEAEDEQLFDALRHLKFNKHEVVLFHLLDRETELSFNFENTPKRYKDVETGMHIDLFADTIRDAYEEEVMAFMSDLKLTCAKYKIKYVPVDIRESFAKVLNTFMIERQAFG
jgi:uncharacterized protein (DUF58 family)